MALDVGTRRTGVAFLDPRVGFVLPLDTLEHRTMEELRDAVIALAEQRPIDTLIVGLPLLPSGVEGSQAAIVREFVALLAGQPWKVVLKDERYTTIKHSSFDGDAKAACSLLETQ